MSEGYYVFDPNRLVTYWAIRRTENETTRIVTPDERHLFDLLSNLTNMQTLSPPNVLRVCNFVERRRSFAVPGRGRLLGSRAQAPSIVTDV